VAPASRSFIDPPPVLPHVGGRDYCGPEAATAFCTLARLPGVRLSPGRASAGLGSGRGTPRIRVGPERGQPAACCPPRESATAPTLPRNVQSLSSFGRAPAFPAASRRETGRRAGRRYASCSNAVRYGRDDAGRPPLPQRQLPEAVRGRVPTVVARRTDPPGDGLSPLRPLGSRARADGGGQTEQRCLGPAPRPPRRAPHRVGCPSAPRSFIDPPPHPPPVGGGGYCGHTAPTARVAGLLSFIDLPPHPPHVGGGGYCGHTAPTARVAGLLSFIDPPPHPPHVGGRGLSAKMRTR
jgi:hypothetical protein